MALRKRNKTIIKADRIEHLDVAKVHNPRTRRNGKADILQQGVKAGLLPAGLVTDLQRLEEGRFPADPARRANLLQRALKIRNDLVYQNLVEENLLGEAVQRALYEVIAREQRRRSRRNPRRGSRSWFGSTETQSFFTRILKSRAKLDLYKDGLEGKEISYDHIPGGSFAFQYAVGRVEPGGEIAVFRRRADERGTYGGWRWETDQNKIIPFVEKSTSGQKTQKANAKNRRNPAEKDPEHPVEVTRHFRGGPPGYLSPWQKAMAIGQQELFDTGIKLAPRAAELRAARMSNPGATKPVYQSGLKQATAGQLPRLARVGLRVGRTPAEIRSDLATTGRFSADQIRRAIDQATTAERRSNPTKRGGRNPREYDGPSYKFLVIEMVDPNKPWGGVDWFRLNDADRIKRNLLSMQRSGIYPPGPQRFEIFDTRNGGWRRTGQYITIDPITYQAIPEEENPRKRSRRNPPVRQIFETFNGRPATKTTSVQAPRRTPARVAQLGRLRLIRTADGRTWRFPGERAPFLAADSRGKLHVVGGQYRANPAGEECGEIEQIEYQTSKPHLGHDHETIYYHQLGEETGERPVLEITPEGELQIIGGNYRIEADGIHN